MRRAHQRRRDAHDACAAVRCGVPALVLPCTLEEASGGRLTGRRRMTGVDARAPYEVALPLSTTSLH